MSSFAAQDVQALLRLLSTHASHHNDISVFLSLIIKIKSNS